MTNIDPLEGLNIDRELDRDFDINVGNDDDVDDEFESLQKYIHEKAPPPERWYHGQLDREDAERRLIKNGTPCSYLVRESDRKPGVYSLSYLTLHKSLSHFRITAICGDYYIGGRKFESLQHLIGYYSTYGSLVKNEKLENPVAPAEPVHLAYRIVAKFPYEGTHDSDELSFAAGEVFSVQNVMDDDWFWVVSQKDNKSGLVPKALTEAMAPNADPFEGQSWFCDVDKHEAETILLNYGEKGHFIIRPSQNQGDYSMCLRENKTVTRYLIRRQGQRFMFGGRPFDSIEAVISRYMKEQLAEGVSLRMPLPREKYETFYRNLKGSVRYKTPELVDGDNVPQIVSLRLSSHMSETNSSFKTGFLIKKGSRNKWKRFYIILKGDEQQLLYFENEKRTKPKGLFELDFAAVYTVHDSLFGRPNCFQIVVRVLNETQTYFMCAESSDHAQEWIEAIRKFCGRKSQTKQLGNSSIKELRSLEVTICHAQKIPVNKLPHPYCIVSLNDIKTCRTKAQEAPEPVFDEEFKFEDLPMDITSYTVSIYNRNKDKEMGRVTVNLNKLEPGKALDTWFTLTSATNKTEMGSVRITSKFVHEIIMPVEEYVNLKEVLLSKDYMLVQSLGETSKDLNALAYTLLRIFRQANQEIQLIKTITSRELNNREKKETLFRGNTLATKLMDQYMKMVAIPYLQTTIKSVILKIMDSKQNCELSPSRVEKGSNVAENLQQLIKFLEEITSNIFNSKNSCPQSLRYLFHCLQSEAKSVWPEEPEILSRVVSSFLFLRLIVPAVLNPKMHNLVHESPSQMASRTLTLVAMCLQKLANLVEFGAKEPYLVVVNPFLQKYREKMVDFLDDISNYPNQPNTSDEMKHESTRDLARDLASIHETCIKHDHQLQKLSSTQPHVKILLAIVEGVKRQKEQFMAQSEGNDEFVI